MADRRAGRERRRAPRWRGSVRARTTAASTLVVAVALVGAGGAVLAVLHRNLVDATSLQAEVTAREVATQITNGAEFSSLALPNAENQPVQVVKSDGTVLAAGPRLRGAPPFAGFAPAPRQPRRPADPDDRVYVPGSAATTVRFDTVRFRLPGVADARPYRVAAVYAATARDHIVTVYAGASLNTERQAITSARNVMMLGLLPLIAVIALASWLVTRRALRPVEAIRAELAEIMKGDLSRRVPQPDARDEVARLAATTNATLAALEESAGRQRRFIADASHELRSPITSLRTQLEVARAHPELLEIGGLIDDTLRLERLASDLLLLARLDAGEPPRTERVDLAALVREELAHRAADRVPVTAALPGRPTAVTGNRAQLAHVLGNLVDNAQRHAVSAVTVTVRRADDRVTLEVADDGPGVPAADRERIFERFVRLDDARSRDDGGSGLGLAIVRNLTHRHLGTIEVTEAPGGGARFVTTLPAAPG
ncbi:sensor histidine kinase [Streptantibioticus cattleyicolor]|uniref:histidine kinase n=1 Tax=Streptantibioticus cattleyicolor (strain ATCC 35852 / DSM 46488 / JCM 4925 / NBRC 14057 / NRRL 8057) TaxID=1003195 RepID=F8JJ65_STREN|nr:HAMP domain-containing sensor histidine kinase [Streptantibioticus cattleyicolor]AEW98835.1 sensory histidine kinase [Streptantibioticus cattleyicolor NRRL 8057 = DSM 46488]CCB72118.1 Sensor protein [Streptantibioticus cattleyicolor NRRL 8057 = DSM 46488]